MRKTSLAKKNYQLVAVLHEDLRRYLPPEDIVAVILSIMTVKFYDLRTSKSNMTLHHITSQSPIELKGVLLDTFKAIEKSYPFLTYAYSNLAIDWSALDDTVLSSVIKRIDQMDAASFPSVLEELFQHEIHLPGTSPLEISTPLVLKKIMTRLLGTKKDHLVYDGTAGFAGNLRTLLESISFPITVYAQEIDSKVGALGKLGLFFYEHATVHFQIEDTLLAPAFSADEKLMRFDRIIMTPPFNQKMMKSSSVALTKDPYDRFIYGNVPRTSSDLAFIQHVISSLNSRGKAVMLVPIGALYRGGKEQEIRDQFIAEDLIERVILFPANIMHNTSVPVCIVVFNKDKTEENRNKIQFVNASELVKSYYSQASEMDTDIERLLPLIFTLQDYAQQSEWVHRSQISNGNLVPTKYLDSHRIQIEDKMFQVFPSALKNQKQLPLHQLGHVFNGLNANSKNTAEALKKEGAYQLVQLRDIENNSLQMNTLRSIDILQKSIERYILQEGDFIVNSRGLPTRMAVVPKHEGTLILSQNFIGFRPLDSQVDSNFLKFYLESPIGQYYLQRALSTNTTTVLLPKSFSEVLCPVPPLDVQRQFSADYEQAITQYQKKVSAAERELVRAQTNFYKRLDILKAFQPDN